MPVVEIKWYKGRSKEVKQKVASAIEKIMQEDAGCKPGATYTTFQDFEKSDWAINGKLGE